MLEKDDKIGDYSLVRFLGKGQFGEVWLAEKQLQFSTRKVRHALKFLSNLGEEVNLKAAEAEVDTWIEAGGHPNVMSVIDMLIANNHIVIISEYAEGGSLNNWLKTSGGKAPDEEQALEMMAGILRGIEHLHSRNVIHRDLKPDNILLQGSFPRITDFGISRIVNEGTMSTKAIGSPAYMSPESFAGNKSPQADIWSAGVILYEMLTAKFPFENESVWGLVHQIQTEEAKPLPPEVSPESRAIVENALQKDVGKRFQTASEMRLAIERAIYKSKGAEQKHIATEKFENVKLTEPQISVVTDEQTKSNSRIIESNESSDKSHADNLTTVKTETESKVSQETYNPLAETEKFIQETQPSPPSKTDDQQIEQTVDWREAERQKHEEQQADFEKLSSDFERNRTSGAQSKKKPLGLIAGIASGIIGLSLIGVLLWAMSGNSNSVVKTAESNSAKNTSAANNSNKTNSPAAPEKMVYVAGGEFMMGRDDGKSETEKPAHKVSVQPFYMDVYETTNEQYAEFVKATNRKPPNEWKNNCLLYTSDAADE